MKRKNASTALHRLHVELYRKLRADAQLLLGSQPASITSYERSAIRALAPALRRRTQAASHAELIRSVRTADVTFIGDYHTFAQAQRTALRIARAAVKPGERWMLGLEMFPSSTQKYLDQFIAGRISEAAFLKRIRYAEKWGFSWENYRPLLDWARAANVEVVALNRPEETFFSLPETRDSRELQDRDEWAAGIITDCFSTGSFSGSSKRPAGRMRFLVVYGELHVARPHLPRRLESVSRAFLGRSLRSLVVHQNQDAFFWKALSEHPSGLLDLLRLDEGAFCVFSGTPWTQLQSLIHWTERTGSAEHDSDSYSSVSTSSSSEASDPLHCLSQMRFYAEAVARFLGVASPQLDDLHVHVRNKSRALADIPGLSLEERRIVHWHLKAGRRLYVPLAHTAFAGKVSQNGLLELAALHLLFRRHRSTPLFSREAGESARLIMVSAFGFFASLLLNPKRKCAGLRDLARPPVSIPTELRRAHRLAARLHNHAIRGGRVTFPRATRPETAFIASTLAGRALGARIFRALLENKASIPEIRAAFFSRKGAPDWPRALQGLIKICRASNAG